MRMRNCLALAMAAGMACTALAQNVIITEVVDGDLAGGNPKFVEITNVGQAAFTFAAGDVLRNYNNGGTAPSATVSLDGITLNPGESRVFANTNASINQTIWDGVYGSVPGVPTFVSGITINGDDAVALEIGGVVVDTYGVIGVDGTGTAWDHIDGYARRNANVCAPNATFTASEWTIGGPLSLDGPDDATRINLLQTNTNPGTHTFSCGSFIDCNDNGIDDAVEIAGNPALDCNDNGTLDSCEIAANSTLDCNSNGVIDTCEIAANPGLDTNNNGRLDECETPSPTGIIITEVVDGSRPGGNPKYVEIMNVGSAPVTLGNGIRLRVYANGSTTANTAAVYDFGGANSVTLSPGQTFTIASNFGTNPTGDASWFETYGLFNLPNVFVSSVPGNGNDVYALESDFGVFDVFGVIGQDGFGQPWEYTDSVAVRRPTVATGSSTFDINQWIVLSPGSLNAGALVAGTLQNSSLNGPIWASNVRVLTTPNAHYSAVGGICTPGTDCNADGIPDACQIGQALYRDANANSVLDSCEVTSATDCNGNGVFDFVEIGLTPEVDCNSNGILDVCEIAAGQASDSNNDGIPDSCQFFDCNNNSINDFDEIAQNPSLDCNGNSIPDSCELFNGGLTDANGNGIPDACEGAAVVECFVNGTVQVSGVRAGTNGAAFMNVQGSAAAEQFRSYGAFRFDIGAIASQLDAQFGAGGWEITSAYVYLIQNNAGFTEDGNLELYHTDNDTILIDPGTTTTTFGNFFSGDATLGFGGPGSNTNSILTYTFTQGLANDPDPIAGAPFTYTANGSGKKESYQMYDASNPTAGGQAVAADISAATGTLTLLLNEVVTDPANIVAATYSGYTNFNFAGAQVIVFAQPATGDGCPACAADYNQDDGVDDLDIASFFADFENGEPCADVNGDDGIDDLDISFFFTQFEQGC